MNAAWSRLQDLVAAPSSPHETRGSSVLRPTVFGAIDGLVATLIALFLVGLGVSRLTHRQPVRSGLRQAAMGLLAAGMTYGVGTLLGTAVH